MASSSSSFSFLICIISISALTLPTHSTTPKIPSSYSHHCSSTLPVSPPTHLITKHHSLPNFTIRYFTGGDQLLHLKDRNNEFYYGQKSLRLKFLPDFRETSSPGVYLIQAILRIRSPYIDFDHYLKNSLRPQSQGSVSFSLIGFWSETSMKACMVGLGYKNFDEGGRTLNIRGVLKFKYVSEKSIVGIHDSVIRGTLKSMSSKNDSGYFDPISMFSFPDLPHYNYSLLSKEFSSFSTSGVAKSRSLSLDTNWFCSKLSSWRSTFLDMKYTGNCTQPELCSPLGTSFLPRHLSLMPIQCSTNEKKIRYIARFMTSPIDDGFSIETSLIAEGVWDDETNQLFVGACRMLNLVQQFDDPIMDCGIRFSLRYPSVLTIRNDWMIVGELWSKEEGYFPKIELTASDNSYSADEIWGQKHEYTDMSRVLKSCPVENTAWEEGNFPDVKSGDIKFDLFVYNSKGESLASGYAMPVFVGEELYQSSVIALKNMPEDSETKRGTEFSISKISYKISLHPYWSYLSNLNSSKRFSKLNMSLSLHEQIDINAEGVYNVQTGQLCMVGCRKTKDLAEVSTDCEILLKIEFPPLNDTKAGLINGTIVSTRREEDPLHFENLTLSAAAFYLERAEKSLWRIDLEIVFGLVSNTLFCIFVAFQIFHMKKNPQVVSSVSLTMVLILVLGHAIPLALNIADVFSKTYNGRTMLVGGGAWLEANEVAFGAITLVSLTLLLRILRLVWTVKQHEGLDMGQWSPWSSEKRASLVTLLLHSFGALLFLLLLYRIIELTDDRVPGHLRAYGGLIVDGFLLPQIILNAVGGSTEKALSNPFYMGTTVVRLTPHVYNMYSLQNRVVDPNGMYNRPDPADEFLSVGCNAFAFSVVPMAVVVFLQQSYL